MRAADRRKRRQEMLPAADILSALLAGYHVDRDVRERRILIAWPAIVGPQVAAHTRPGPVVDGVLGVRVSSSTWLHELSFAREQLVARINQIVGDPPLVTEVRLTLGQPRVRDAEDAQVIARRRTRDRRALPPPRRALPPPADGARLARIRAETDAVDDPELRAIILEARRKLDC